MSTIRRLPKLLVQFERLECRRLLNADGIRPQAVNPATELPLQAEYRLARDEFELMAGTPHRSSIQPRSQSPFNGEPDYREVVFRATIEAGIPTGPTPDTPTRRVDPNDANGKYTSVGSLEISLPIVGTLICTGAVIGDIHVLTAAHCFDINSDGVPDTADFSDSVFHLNDGASPSSTTTIERVDFHPDFGGFQSSGAYDDLAIVTLAQPVPDGTEIYAIRDTAVQRHEVIDIVGYGITGHGDVAGIEQMPDATVKRAGKNVIDLFVVDDEGSGRDEVYLYDFDGPIGTGLLGGQTLGNDVETLVRHGDSGGPAFVEEAGTLLIVGVNTFDFALEGVTGGPGEFGAVGGGSVIGPSDLDWIRSIVPLANNSTPEEPTAESTEIVVRPLRRAGRLDTPSVSAEPPTVQPPVIDPPALNPPPQIEPDDNVNALDEPSEDEPSEDESSEPSRRPGRIDGQLATPIPANTIGERVTLDTEVGGDNNPSDENSGPDPPLIFGSGVASSRPLEQLSGLRPQQQPNLPRRSRN